MPQIVIDVVEINKLNQFQLLTGLETIILFPLDQHGTAWRPLRPGWIVANGMKRKFDNSWVFVVDARKVEKIKLSFELES